MVEKNRGKSAGDVMAETGDISSGLPESSTVHESDSVKTCGFQLNVELDGLIAFVPSRNRDRMKALLVNAVMPGSHASDNHCYQMPSHYPFIQFKGGDKSPNNKTDPDLVLLGGQSVRFLDWEDLSVVYK